jgi:signal transduction histidine kinase
LREKETSALFRDRDGSLWIGVEGGLLHVHQEKTDVFAQSDGLSGDHPSVFFEDREGSVWAVTSNGLDRFRDVAVTTFGAAQGLSKGFVGSVLAARDASVWLGTTGGLNRWRNGTITVPATGAVNRDGKLDGRSPHSLFQDERGRIWISTGGGIGTLENDRFVPITGVPGGTVRAIAEDAGGNVWVANQDHGLFRLSARGGVQQIPWTRLGHTDAATALLGDASRDGLWVGFYEGGVVHFSDGRVGPSYAAADGLGTGRVNAFRLDPDGALWIATEGGLSRLKDGRLATLTSGSGLPCDAVHWALEDDARSFWLDMPCGLVRIPRSELDAWITAVDKNKGTKPTVQATVFDSSDGVRSRGLALGHFPLSTRSTDGRLWFVSTDGVSVVDPRHLPFNKLPPPVYIEQVVADRKAYDAATATGRLLLPPLVPDVAIDYTATSLVAPEKVRFRYKLEGRDNDWLDAGTRRQAFYSDLRPAHYRFRVTASNNSGVWNESGAFLDFSVAPAWYQTGWFRLSCVAAFAGLLAALHRLRLQQVTRQVKAHMEGRLEERERIARELHDTLLQSVQGLILKFDAVARKIPAEAPTRRAIEETLDRADEILAEGRDRVRTLRGAAISLADLPAAFQRVANEAARERGATFKSVVEGRERELDPIVLEESFSIGREALLNALAHSGGLHVEVEITYDPRQFRLRIRDDGRGIDPEILRKGGRSDHWGLQGMRERARKIGAQLELWSRPGAGTEVELKVPAATAYRGST